MGHCGTNRCLEERCSCGCSECHAADVLAGNTDEQQMDREEIAALKAEADREYEGACDSQAMGSRIDWDD